MRRSERTVRPLTAKSAALGLQPQIDIFRVDEIKECAMANLDLSTAAGQGPGGVVESICLGAGLGAPCTMDAGIIV